MDHPLTPQSVERPWRRILTPEQASLAGEIQARAERLRNRAAADGDSLSIRQAIELASVQMGVAS